MSVYPPQQATCLWCGEATERRSLCQPCWDTELRIRGDRLLSTYRQLLHMHSTKELFSSLTFRRLSLVVSIIVSYPSLIPKLMRKNSRSNTGVTLPSQTASMPLRGKVT